MCMFLKYRKSYRLSNPFVSSSFDLTSPLTIKIIIAIIKLVTFVVECSGFISYMFYVFRIWSTIIVRNHGFFLYM